MTATPWTAGAPPSTVAHVKPDVAFLPGRMWSMPQWAVGAHAARLSPGQPRGESWAPLRVGPPAPPSRTLAGSGVFWVPCPPAHSEDGEEDFSACSQRCSNGPEPTGGRAGSARSPCVELSFGSRAWTLQTLPRTPSAAKKGGGRPPGKADVGPSLSVWPARGGAGGSSGASPPQGPLLPPATGPRQPVLPLPARGHRGRFYAVTERMAGGRQAGD